VTSHLAAFTDKTERRNQDFTELSKRLLFEHNYTEKTSYVSYSWNDGGDEGVTFLENQNIIRDWRENASIYHNE
jgi:phosphatidylinositol-bisphosphatase